MRPNPASIKGRLFLWIFLFITAILIVRGFSIYSEMEDAAYLSIRHSLHSKIQILKGLVYEKNGTIEMARDEIISGEYIIPRSGYYYKVFAGEKVLAVSPSLVEKDFNLVTGAPEETDEPLKESIYFSTGPDKEPLMVVQHDFRILDMPVRIYAAQDLSDTLSSIRRFRNFFLISIPLNLFIVALAGLWIARQSLKPLNILSSRIEKISHKTLSERIDTRYQAEEIKGLAESFNSMLDRLQRAFEAEKRLIADASHELKTPLAVIMTHCDVLLQKDRSRDEYTRALNAIKAASDSLNRLIDDMLSMARLDSGILSVSDFRTVRVRDCIERAAMLTEAEAGKKHVKITSAFTEDVCIPGDEDMLTEAFLNIIENAVKYGRKGGVADISAARDGNNVKISVCDNGIGIREQDLDRIFDRFYRADYSRSTKGTGLGLSIAKAIIESHGGEIKVQSEYGKGSCFTVVFPENRVTAGN